MVTTASYHYCVTSCYDDSEAREREREREREKEE